MTEYDSFHVRQVDEIPADAPISTLRFGSTGYWAPTQSVDSATRGRLAEEGVEVVEDLGGWSEKDLLEIKGVGPVTAEALITAADLASVDYRGQGFPWEVEVPVHIPDEYVEEFSRIGERSVREAFSTLLEEEWFDKVVKLVREQRKEALNQEIQELEEKLQELEENNG